MTKTEMSRCIFVKFSLNITNIGVAVLWMVYVWRRDVVMLQAFCTDVKAPKKLSMFPT